MNGVFFSFANILNKCNKDISLNHMTTEIVVSVAVLIYLGTVDGVYKRNAYFLSSRARSDDTFLYYW